MKVQTSLAAQVAALTVALNAVLNVGGWKPKGSKTEILPQFDENAIHQWHSNTGGDTTNIAEPVQDFRKISAEIKAIEEAKLIENTAYEESLKGLTKQLHAVTDAGAKT